jgi:hypothetical protein
MSIAIFERVIDRVVSGYGRAISLEGIFSGKSKEEVRLFLEAIDGYHIQPTENTLIDGEFPILECNLINGNYFLMTTSKMVSICSKIEYNLFYHNYWWFDPDVYQENFPNWSKGTGETVVYKYYSQEKDVFWYEINSGYPADIAHNCILFEMEQEYIKERPPLKLLFPFR